MKKLIFLLFFLFISLIVKSQDIPGEGLIVVEFNAPFSNSSCEYLDKLKDADIARIDIFPNLCSSSYRNMTILQGLNITK